MTYSKEEVKYTDKGTPSEHCNICTHYKAQTQDCEIVRGKISPQGWCDKFEKA